VVVVDFRLDATRGPPAELRLSHEQVASELNAGGLVPQIIDTPLTEQYVVEGVGR
jgi:hypothetical protein